MSVGNNIAYTDERWPFRQADSCILPVHFNNILTNLLVHAMDSC